MSASAALTPAQNAQIQQAITSIQGILQGVLSAVSGTYTRTQLSAARQAIAYYTTLSQNVANLVASLPSTQYTVEAGDTLHTIAQFQLGDATLFSAIMAANNIPDQNITPGQVLTMPLLVGSGQ